MAEFIEITKQDHHIQSKISQTIDKYNIKTLSTRSKKGQNAFIWHKVFEQAINVMGETIYNNILIWNNDMKILTFSLKELTLWRITFVDKVRYVSKNSNSKSVFLPRDTKLKLPQFFKKKQNVHCHKITEKFNEDYIIGERFGSFEWRMNCYFQLKKTYIDVDWSTKNKTTRNAGN